METIHRFYNKMKNRKNREIIAINEENGECRKFESVSEFAKEHRVIVQAAQSALERGWACDGWKIYDMPERIRERMRELESQIEVVEAALSRVS